MEKKTLTRSDEIRPVIGIRPGRQLSLSRPLVMGILNVTPDSFSDGGRFSDPNAAITRALAMVEDGADIIDIGGESTRPGAEPVPHDEELRRVVPVVEALRKGSDVVISIDTYKAQVARRALEAGADIVNDIAALRFDPDLATVAAEFKAPVVLMHMLGEPRHMQKNPSYVNCVEEIAAFFEERIEFCRAAGIDKAKLILDPGIGFGKRLNDNLEILSKLMSLRRFGLPLLVGASRKSFIGMLHPTGTPADTRIGGSIAAAVMAVANGAAIVRVHDVAETVEALKVLQGIRETR